MINLLCCLPNPKDATSFYRGMGPLSHLKKLIPDLNILHTPARTEYIEWPQMFEADICFLQRPQTREQMRIAELAKECNVPLWVEYDDDLLTVQKDNPCHEIYNDHDTQVLIRYIMGLADVVTVATQHHADQWAGYNKNIHVINNAIDDYRFNLNASAFNKDSKTILWRGSASHQADLDEHEESIVSLANELSDWQMVFIGYRPWRIEKRIKNGVYIPMLKLLTYFEKLKELKPRVQIVPLVDNVFNRTKSNIAWIEATYAGANTVGPSWDEWPAKFLSYGPDLSIKDSVLWLLDNEGGRYWQDSMDKVRSCYSLSRTNALRANIIKRYS